MHSTRGEEKRKQGAIGCSWPDCRDFRLGKGNPYRILQRQWAYGSFPFICSLLLLVFLRNFVLQSAGSSGLVGVASVRCVGTCHLWEVPAGHLQSAPFFVSFCRFFVFLLFFTFCKRKIGRLKLQTPGAKRRRRGANRRGPRQDRKEQEEAYYTHWLALRRCIASSCFWEVPSGQLQRPLFLLFPFVFSFLHFCRTEKETKRKPEE